MDGHNFNSCVEIPFKGQEGVRCDTMTMCRYFRGHTIIICHIFLTEKEWLDARWRRIRMNTTGKLASIIMGRCIIIVNIIYTVIVRER